MTSVAKTNRAIKAILKHTLGEYWAGRDLSIEEVDPSWTYADTLPGEREGDYDRAVYWAAADGSNGYKVGDSKTDRTPRGLSTLAPTSHFAVIVEDIPAGYRAKFRSATIYIPRLDEAQMDVARDAMLAGDKTLLKTLLSAFGRYAGIAGAILEHQVRTFRLAANPKKSTRKIRLEVDEFLRAHGRA